MSGSAFLITPEEMSALSGAGPMGTCIYLWLRSWMDFNTGIVGNPHTISLGKLEAYCETEVPKGAGVQLVRPSRDQVRRVLERLKAAGLLERLDTELLVFRLPLATTGKPRPNQTRRETATGSRHESTTDKPTPLSGNQGHNQGEPAAGYEGEPAIHQGSDSSFSEYKKSNHQSVSEEIARETDDVDFSSLPDDWVHDHLIGWVNQFNIEFGCRLVPSSDRFQRSDRPVLEGWVARGVSLGAVRAIIGRAKASAGSRINNPVLYVNAGLANDSGLSRGSAPVVSPASCAPKSDAPAKPPLSRDAGMARVDGIRSLTTRLKRYSPGGKHG